MSAEPRHNGSARLRTLIVEDSEDDALLLLRELRRGGYEPVHERVETPEEMREALARSAWDLIISDYRLPRFDAPAALGLARETGSGAPFVVVSGRMGDEEAVAAMKAGAHDYVMKDNLARLCATVERGLDEAQKRREHRETAHELQRRDAILAAVGFAAERLLGQTAGWEESVGAVLRRLGEAAAVSRVYVFENFAEKDGELWNAERHKWVAPGVRPGLPAASGGARFPYRDDGSGRRRDFGRWEEVLGRGEPLHGNVRDFPEKERAFLMEELGILSMVLVPIFVEGRWWGFIGFDECVKEREWSGAEIGALGAAAGTLGAAIRRRQVEEQLRASEVRYRAVVEQATDGIYLLDADSRLVLETNPSFQEMLGYAAGELLGMPVYDFVAHPREDVDATIGHTLEKRRRVVGGRKYRRRDGTLVDVEVGVSVISLDGRDVICTVVRDVTERKRVEEALARSEGRLRTIVETEPECVKVLDKDGVLLEMNPAGLSMIEADSLEQVRGLPVYDYIAPGHRDAFVALTESVIRGGSGTLEFELVGLKGTRRWLETHAVPLREAGGGIAGLLAITRDVTERKRDEEALQESERLYRAVVEQATENIFLIDVESRRIVESNQAFRESLGYSAEELHAMTLYDVVAHDRRSVDANIRSVTEGRNPSVGERKYLRKDGSLLDMEVSAIVVLREGRRTICAVAHDVTERRRAQDLLEERVATLSRISAGLTMDLPGEATLNALAEGAVGASTAVACGVVLLDGEAGRVDLFGSHGLPGGYTEGLREAYRNGVRSPSLEAFRTRRPVLVHGMRQSILADPVYAPVHRFVRDASWDVVYSLPLVSRGKPLGAMFFCFLPGGEPGEDERTFLRAVADQAAIAVENANLLVEARERAALEERQRLARELHDSVSQALYGIVLGTETARNMLEDGPSEAAEPLDYVLSLAEAGMAEMRALIFELRPESLEQEGLVAALAKQVSALEARHGISVEDDLGEEPPAPLPVKEAVYRIAQEALHNTVRHARAKKVGIRVLRDHEHTIVEVEDDGLGFDAGSDFPGHLGLRSMRERAVRLGGTLEVLSAPGSGTTVRARIPLDPGV
ncbi:PAS domain S-box protein [Rubrobacter tropicus]|uniref:PAS domain S-box protein n=1 Tax=Rubrobacter tropicus TaxID=2653851 RepID=A0A6G8Q6J3_9ACTN|nr:PAS domain S-box protein [Rubrobacter tropicus]QIN82082.1 PAS domain S-box protein [Rubrobacter tropicus]